MGKSILFLDKNKFAARVTFAKDISELVKIWYILHFAADNLDAKEWDRRSLGDEVKFEEKDMFAQLALELAVRIS